MRGFLILVPLVTVAMVGCSVPAGREPTPSAAPPSRQPSEPMTPLPTPVAQSVDIGGRSLHLECQGTGSPTVILEAGLAGDHRTWENVQPAVAEVTRVCAYDRANIAPSDPAPKPRTAGDVVADLHALLAEAEIEPPYVLIGFSFGGLTTQLYAATYPDDIAGLVLVESSHPDEADQFEAQLTPEQIEDDRAAVLDNPEGIDLFASFEQAQVARSLPQVPLVVVTAGISDGWPPGWDAELFDRLRAEQQADLATLTADGRQVIAEESAHDVPRQAPEVIIDAVESVLAGAAGA